MRRKFVLTGLATVGVATAGHADRGNPGISQHGGRDHRGLPGPRTGRPTEDAY